MKTLTFILGMGAFAFGMSSCEDSETSGMINNSVSINIEEEINLTNVLKEDSLGFAQCDSAMDFPLEDLSDAEIMALNLMREEEILARDVYSALYEIWNIPIFKNISKSENMHTSAVLKLIEKYELDDIAANYETGVFENEELQELYKDLVKRGSQSLDEALQVGATIEDLDIVDLIKLQENIDNQDINFVFENLKKGSRNHIRSFYRLITLRGNDYEPQFLSESDFQEIISTPHERGRIKI